MKIEITTSNPIANFIQALNLFITSNTTFEGFYYALEEFATILHNENYGFVQLDLVPTIGKGGNIKRRKQRGGTPIVKLIIKLVKKTNANQETKNMFIKTIQSWIQNLTNNEAPQDELKQHIMNTTGLIAYKNVEQFTIFEQMPEQSLDQMVVEDLSKLQAIELVDWS